MFDAIISICKRAKFCSRIAASPNLWQSVLTMLKRARASRWFLPAFNNSVPMVCSSVTCMIEVAIWMWSWLESRDSHARGWGKIAESLRALWGNNDAAHSNAGFLSRNVPKNGDSFVVPMKHKKGKHYEYCK